MRGREHRGKNNARIYGSYDQKSLGSVLTWGGARPVINYERKGRKGGKRWSVRDTEGRTGMQDKVMGAVARFWVSILYRRGARLVAEGRWDREENMKGRIRGEG